jgi:O-antigen/teichoic acid export membrane protein
VLYVVIRGSIYRPPFFKRTAHLGAVVASIGFILLSALIDNVTLHADRILLLAITGDGNAVTVYYVASLVGKIVSMLTLPINAIMLSYLIRYQGGLTKKLWSVIIAVAVLFGAVAFAGCMIVSPWLIGILYPDQAAEVRGILAPAILGQIFYFVSGVLMMVLLRFKGERKQLIFNGGYAVEFFGCVAAGTALYGLWGFIYSILIANGIRFLGTVIWGFLPAKNGTEGKMEKAS